jgi:DNA polymerase I-like protein with 3'-5' exonuclease and polymerase domains
MQGMKIQATTADAYRLFHEGILALARAEREGIRIDVEYCLQKKKQLDRQIEYFQKKLEDSKLYRQWHHIFKGKTNILSNYQLSRILYDKMDLAPEKLTESGQGSTDEEALRRLGIPELDLILRIRKLDKIRGTYLEAFAREQTDGFIHPFFNLHTVRTYRSSSEDPNFQNIPKRDKEAMKICRRAILPRPGHMLVEADFSALEVNIGACYHKDPTMIAYLLDKKSDMHLDMAKQIFLMDPMDKKIPAHGIMRQAAKNGFVFPQFYGDYYGNNARGICDWVKIPQRGKWSSGQGLELPDGSRISDHFRSQGITSFEAFEEHMKYVEDDFWNRRFKKYGQWRKASVAQYRKKGYLKLYTGFTCSGIMGKNEIGNYPIQGSAFHCLLFTFIELDKIAQKERWKSKIVGQIHDSILMDVDPTELGRIKEALQHIVKEILPKAWKWIIVPLDIEVEEYKVDKPWIS